MQCRERPGRGGEKDNKILVCCRPENWIPHRTSRHNRWLIWSVCWSRKLRQFMYIYEWLTFYLPYNQKSTPAVNCTVPEPFATIHLIVIVVNSIINVQSACIACRFFVLLININLLWDYTQSIKRANILTSDLKV